MGYRRLSRPGDHPVGVASVDRVAGDRPEDQPACGALPAAGLQHAQDGDGQRHGGRLVALADQVQHPIAAQGVGVVLDPHSCRLAGPQRIDPQQVRQGTVIDGEGLGDLQEPDELQPVQSLGAGLVAVIFGSRAYTAGSEPIGRRCERSGSSRTACIIVFTEESIRPGSPRSRMYSLTWARWTPTNG